MKRTLLTIPVLLLLVLASCRDFQAPTEVADAAEGKGSRLLHTGSSEDAQRGCTTWDVRVLGKDRIEATPVERAACGPVQPVLTGVPVFDNTKQSIRLPIALMDRDGARMRAPARLFGWEDSLVVTSPPGLTRERNRDRVLTLVAPDSIAADTDPLRGARVWRYDEQLTSDGERSEVRWIEIQVHPGVHSFRMTLHSQAERCSAEKASLLVVGEGVVGSPAAGVSEHRCGTRIPYSFSPASGYENVLVSIDHRLAPASGTIRVDSIHLLYASADRTVELPPETAPLVESARAVLTENNPVAAYQRHLNHVADLVDQVGVGEARRRLSIVSHMAYDPVRDSASIRRVDSALRGHTFDVHPASGSIESMSEASMPVSSAEVSRAGNLMPLTILHINGVFTDFRTLAQVQVVDLKSIVEESLGAAGSTYDWRVKGVYNRTAIESIESVHNEHARCLRLVAPSVQYLGGNAVVLRYGQCRGLTNFYAATFDLIEALQQMLQLSGANFATEPDATVLADSIEYAMVRGKRNVILVPHSQGNLMAQQATGIVRARGQISPRVAQCVSVLSVAAPTSRNWPLSNPGPVRGYIVEHDILLKLGQNSFKQVRTDLGNRMMRQVLQTYSGRYFLDWYTRFRLHLPFVTYFVTWETRTETGSLLKSLAARNCSQRFYQGTYRHTSPSGEVWWYPGFHIRMDIQEDRAAVEYYTSYSSNPFAPVYKATVPIADNSVPIRLSYGMLAVDMMVRVDTDESPCVGTGTYDSSVGTASCFGGGYPW